MKKYGSSFADLYVETFGEVDLAEILLCIKHQMKTKKTKVGRPKKKPRYCVHCERKIRRAFVTHHSYSRVSSGGTYYTCSKTCQKKFESTLTTEDEEAYKHQNCCSPYANDRR